MLVDTRERHGGVQALFRFENGYGASVIRGPYTYGGPEGLFELGVIVWGGNNYELTYDTPLTDDVIGYLSDAEVVQLLDDIEALPPLDRKAISG